MVNFQGRVLVNGTNFTGIARFKFAMVNGGVTYWSHDGTSANGSAPVSSLEIPVAAGLYSVMLGDTTILNQSKTLPANVFTNSAVFLRVWMDDGSHGLQQLVPDQRIGSVGYALNAAGVNIGAITTAMLADGAVSGAKVKPGSIAVSQLDDGGAGAYQQLQVTSGSEARSNALAFESMLPVVADGVSVTFSLDGANLGNVISFSGSEGISEPYEYSAQVLLPDPEIVPENVLGRAARILFVRNGRSTRFSGVVTACALSSHDGSLCLYTFRIGPAFSYLGRNTDYRVFQNLTVPEIASEIYSSITGASLTSVLTATHRPREMAIQYRESSLDFFNRILERDGVHYSFRLASSSPGLVLGDDNTGFPAAPNSPFRYYGNVATNPPAGSEFLRSLHGGVRDTSLSSQVKDYDFTRPDLNLSGAAIGPGGHGQHYTFGSWARTASDIESAARWQQDGHTAERNRWSGTANAPDIRAGYTIAVEDATSAGLRGSFLITASRHGAFRRMVNGVVTWFYGNQFEAIPISVPFRPLLKTPRPDAQPCTAIVTAPAGEAGHPWTDSFGRVHVQFHWDRYGTGDDRSSAWVRMVSPVAGSSHSFHFLPRAGDEVLVTFLLGDPDQPVVLGGLYNGQNPPPFALPTERWKNTLRTVSAADRVNEIRLDDTAGSEEIRIASPRLTLSAELGLDVERATGREHSLRVGGLILAGGFQGSGSLLTDLPAGALSGTVPDARLSNNVARLNASQSFTAANSFLGPVGIGIAAGSEALSLGGATRLNRNDIYLREGGDTLHGLGWYGLGKLFSNRNVDGPVLYGCSGGALGTSCNTQLVSLAWDTSGRVSIDPGSVNDGTLNNALVFGSAGTEGIAAKQTAGSSHSLYLFTGGLPRLALGSDGRIGIGTISPARRLHVVDPGLSTASIQVGATSPGSTPKLIYFGDGEYVSVGENGQDDTMELRATRFCFKDGVVGLGIAAASYQLELSSNSAAKPGGGSWASTSDARLKKNIEPLKGSLDRLTRLQGVSFEWQNPGEHGGRAGREGGFVAQQVEEQFPQWVQEVPAGEGDRPLTADGRVKSLSLPFEFDALVVESIKELRAENASLREQNEQIRRELEQMRALIQELRQERR